MIDHITAYLGLTLVCVSLFGSLFGGATKVARAVHQLTSATETNTNALEHLTSVTSEHGERITTLEEITRLRVNQRARELWEQDDRS